MSMRRELLHARSSSSATCLASSRRTRAPRFAGMPRAKTFCPFCHAWMEFKWLQKMKHFVVVDMNTAGYSVRLLFLRFLFQRSLFASSCVPINERSHFSRNTRIQHHHLVPKLCTDQDLPHPILRRAPRVGTVGLRNLASRDPVWESSDKVFGERSARLLASSSSQNRMSSSPTRTSSRTSPACTTTWARTTATWTGLPPLSRMFFSLS
jgi:hypothetical protein